MPYSADMPNECCRKANDAGALLLLAEDQERDDVKVYRCPDCRCRHIEAEVDPLHLNLTGGNL